MLKKLNLSVATIILFLLVFTSFVGAKIAPEALVGAWLFDQNNDASDASGNGHNGKADGKVKWVNGKFGMAVELDGTNAIVIDHADDLSLQTYTLLAWVNIPTAPTDWWTVVAKDGWPNRNYGIWLASGTALLHNSFTSGGAPDNNFVNAVTPINIKEWQHVAATYDMKESKVYINGKLDAKGSFSAKPNITDVPVIIGRTPTNTYKYSGAVDEVAIFSKALSEDEINKIMSEGLKNTVTAVTSQSKLAVTWGDVKKR